jgi:hypothetical protein
MSKGLLRAAIVGSLAVSALFLAMRTAPAQTADVNPASPYIQIPLKQQLEQGLKCRRPIEFQFVDHVADLVSKGKLPLDIVNISFEWSRQRNSYRPFVYFRQSLIRLAAREGIKI